MNLDDEYAWIAEEEKEEEEKRFRKRLRRGAEDREIYEIDVKEDEKGQRVERGAESFSQKPT